MFISFNISESAQVELLRALNLSEFLCNIKFFPTFV